MKPVYMDYSATTPVLPEVLSEMAPFFTEHYGNSSSLHCFGRKAREAMDAARSEIAAAINARPEEIYFCSGGTEADNTAVKGVAMAVRSKGRHIITSAVEHPAVMESCAFMEREGYEVTYLPTDGAGLVDPLELKKAIRADTVLISIMYANNEMGTIQPMQELGALAAEAGVPLHTDAVQAMGTIPMDMSRLQVDLLSASAHKFYGPKGVGFLYVRHGTRFTPLLHGGEQERHRRAGTENVAGVVGCAAALRIAMRDLELNNAHLLSLRDRLTKGILAGIRHSRLNGHPQQRLPNNVNISIDFVEGESMLLNLDLKGVAASTGSACSSGSLEPSHVLLAMGCSHERAHGSLRFSLGRRSSAEEVDYVLKVLPEIVQKLRAMSPLYEEE